LIEKIVHCDPRLTVGVNISRIDRVRGLYRLVIG